MKKFILIPLAVVLLVGLIFSGCTKPVGEVPDEIRIGANMSVTGMLAVSAKAGSVPKRQSRISTHWAESIWKSMGKNYR